MAGKSYEQFVSERILGPLGLNDLWIAISLDQQGRLAPGTHPMARWPRTGTHSRCSAAERRVWVWTTRSRSWRLSIRAPAFAVNKRTLVA